MKLKSSEKIAELSHQYGLDMVVLFGSRSDGTAHLNSDVDIGYSKSEPLSFDDENVLGYEIASVFNTEKFDIVYLNKTSPLFMYEIMKKASLLYERIPSLFSQLFSYSMKRMHENMFLYEMKFDRLCKEYKV